MRAALAGVIATGLLTGCESAASVDPAAEGYDRPGRLVALERGRHIDLRCSGHGTPTVVMIAGFGADPRAWVKVQPTLSRTTRVCIYERAGSGFSDPGPLPRDGAAIARDLDRALSGARIPGPYVVVAHSAGGLYARLFAGRRSAEVRGLLLLDPTLEGAAPAGRDGLGGIRRRIQRCLLAAETKAPQDDPQWQGCIPARADKRTRMIARDPHTWRNQLSELNEIFGRTSQQMTRLGALLADTPLYVITASATADAAAISGPEKPQSIWELRHQHLAESSREGSQRTVRSSHLIMIDRPEVVIEAAEAMIRAARAGTAPPPLPRSETATRDTGPVSATPPRP